MNDAELWAAVLGFFLPLATAVILREKWDDGQKSAAAFVICLIAAAGTAAFAGKLSFTVFDSHAIIRIALIVVSESLVVYRGIWRPTGIAPAINKATG